MTPDIVDEANELAQAAVDTAIESARKAVPEARATGKCLNCGYHVAPGHRWCDADCREDWQRTQTKPYGV